MSRLTDATATSRSAVTATALLGLLDEFQMAFGVLKQLYLTVIVFFLFKNPGNLILSFLAAFGGL